MVRCRSERSSEPSDIETRWVVVKILSVRQPWAHLIIHGSKSIENRSWATKYRGPFLIHASLKIDREACREHGLDPDQLETGGVVGVAEIVDCVTKHRSRWFRGSYGFVLRNRRSVRFVKWTGSLGLREAPARLLKKLGLKVSASLKS